MKMKHYCFLVIIFKLFGKFSIMLWQLIQFEELVGFVSFILVLFNLFSVTTIVLIFLYRKDKVVEKLANELHVPVSSVGDLMFRIATFIALILSSFPLFVFTLSLIVSINIFEIHTLLQGFLFGILIVVSILSFYYANKSVPFFVYWIESLFPLLVLKDKEKKRKIITKNGGILSLFVGAISFVSFINIFLLSFYNLLFVTVYSIIIQSPQGMLTIPATAYFILNLLWSKVDTRTLTLKGL